ncbi:single-stranded-DNA-specific exonuclease RecJ [Candidatus Daviesbacteria bacterium]|nr:single-stranded-DNA-specific exonuclease RecJ [Candidatus Daviesbacteria bacterium]
MPGKVWKILPQKSDDLITQLLINRGLQKTSDIEKFFNPSIEDFQNDLEISGINTSLKRIEKAISLQELIIIYGDYDVDGICASAILYKALSSLRAKVLPYIPHREKEGYGLSKIGLDYARDCGASVIITVDNGIVAMEQANYAKSLGLDLIITDHHLPLEKKPIAFSIVHSTKMCGAAVAWCLIKDIVSKELSKELLQFVAIATVCDMIPMLDLGRVLVKEGLKVLNKSKNIGLISLALECGIDLANVSSYEIGHILGPRLNAIGRLEHAIDALRLICTKDQAKARFLAKLLCETNIKRQQLTEIATEEARVLISKNGTKKIHILDSKTWSPGIIGLIASRVVEEYFRPAIAISVGEVHAKGSARSTQGINIVELIRECSDLLIDVGGHKGAAGFSIKNENIAEFKKRIEKLMDKTKEEVEQVLEIEAEVPLKNLSKSLAKRIEEFSPFGLLNPKPLLVTKEMKTSDVRTLSEGKHLKGKADGIDFIAFGMGDLADSLKSGQLVDLAYYLEINKFNGSENLQLKVKDIQFT